MGCIPAPTCRKALNDATARWPQRNRASDGICGDEAHQARKSDHNDGNAYDLTHDPANGVDCHALALQVINDPRVTYVIWNSRIFKTRTGQWEAYRGTNPHTKHVHVSIRPEARHDLSPWPWSDAAGVKSTLRRGDRGPEVSALQTKLGVDADGIFGFGTENAVKRLQRENGVDPDGVVGAKTWEKLNGRS